MTHLKKQCGPISQGEGFTSSSVESKVIPVGGQADLLGMAHGEQGRYIKRKDYLINRKRIQRLMRLMGIEVIYPKRNSGKPHPSRKIYPYLLRNNTPEEINHLWGIDITYIRMKHGWIHLVVTMVPG